MESYIVRVHRQDQESGGDEVAGLIEDIGADHKTSFQSISGLFATLRQLLGRVEPRQAVVHELRRRKAS